uniref:Uncharacterized protein n=1 Tax=Florenciella sp. virus SA2 TaxID=3240092 RepID=A0AB39JCB3_9VIRU
MDFLNQSSLTLDEWSRVEFPIQNETESLILNMIYDGYNNLNIQRNKYKLLRNYLKLQNKYDYEIFLSFFKDKIVKANKKGDFNINLDLDKSKKIKLSNSDKIRLKNSILLLDNNSNVEDNIIEFKLLNELIKYSKFISKGKSLINDKKVLIAYINIFVLYNEFKNEMNYIFSDIVNQIIQLNINNINVNFIFKHISYLYEHNSIFKYKTLSLYDHQKDLFKIFKDKLSVPKLIFYCAPTSSGKTLSPVALTNQYKVIFVCAAKHIGLSLANSAFNLGIKIGFAFGCDDMDKIRLNYNAINKYKTNKYGKKIPDYSDGTNVEIMICDLMSYKLAMRYMSTFNDVNDLVLFWDEPTIGLDSKENYLHDIIQENWKENIIPNIVLSCATLPKKEEINQIIEKSKNKFEDLYFDYIESVDQLSNICIYDIYGNIIIPHLHFDSYENICEFLSIQGKKYYKFFDCSECAKFLLFLENEFDDSCIKDNFSTLADISLYKIKDIYVNTILQIGKDKWDQLKLLYDKKYPKKNTICKNVGIDITTSNANSLTNGPTLFISDNIENVCKYLLVKAQLDDNIIKNIEKKIDYNRKIMKQLTQHKKDYEDKIEQYKDCENKMTNMRLPPDVLELNSLIEKLENNLISLSLENKYKPNSKDHYERWQLTTEINYEESDVFTSQLGDNDIKEIVELYNIKSLYKLLMLMGIGVFSNNIIQEDKDNKYVKEDNNKYIENMKKLAQNKSLYLIIANSDYIYGTNYQFSHCYLSKDMKDLTQEKIIQCIGRIGRQEKNKHFSFRFRSQEQINIFYSINKNSIESENMNRLFI